MYKVVVRFRDLQDNNRVYNVGDQFPRDGARVGDARIQELSTGANRRGVPLIEVVPEASSEAEKTSETFTPVETPIEKPKAKRRARKAKEEND